jgi:hypothetical protein
VTATGISPARASPPDARQVSNITTATVQQLKRAGMKKF